jgi:UDP-N-acetylglucosamine enolpyruvyl transferase
MARELKGWEPIGLRFTAWNNCTGQHFESAPIHIEVGSFLAAAAATHGELTIEGLPDSVI